MLGKDHKWDLPESAKRLGRICWYQLSMRWYQLSISVLTLDWQATTLFKGGPLVEKAVPDQDTRPIGSTILLLTCDIQGKLPRLCNKTVTKQFASYKIALQLSLMSIQYSLLDTKLYYSLASCPYITVYLI